jgi:hypothetical protein
MHKLRINGGAGAFVLTRISPFNHDIIALRCKARRRDFEGFPLCG